MIEPRDEDGKLNTQNFKKMYTFTFSGTGLAVSFTALGSNFPESVVEHRAVPVFILEDSLFKFKK